MRAFRLYRPKFLLTVSFALIAGVALLGAVNVFAADIYVANNKLSYDGTVYVLSHTETLYEGSPAERDRIVFIPRGFACGDNVIVNDIFMTNDPQKYLIVPTSSANDDSFPVYKCFIALPSDSHKQEKLNTARNAEDCAKVRNAIWDDAGAICNFETLLSPPLPVGLCYVADSGQYRSVACPTFIGPTECGLLVEGSQEVTMIDCSTAHLVTNPVGAELVELPLTPGNCYIGAGSGKFTLADCPQAIGPSYCALLTPLLTIVDCATGSWDPADLVPAVPFPYQQLCEDSSGDWIVEQEVVSGTVIDASYCKCPEGHRLIDGSCITDPANSTDNPGFNEESATVDTDCNPDPPGAPLTRENCDIVKYIVIGVNFLSAVAGMAIIASIMIAGYQYMTAQDNASQIQKAKQRIIWAITALLLFIFMYALLNFLVPGGVL